MMINQPNTLVTTEWVYPLLKEELVSLHGKLRYASEVDELLVTSKEYHNLYSVLKVANLPYFAKLAHAIESTVSAVANELLPHTYVHKSLYASELLLHELTSYVQTGTYHQKLIANRQEHLYQVLLSHDALDRDYESMVSKADLPSTSNTDDFSDNEGFTIDYSATKESTVESEIERIEAEYELDDGHSGISLNRLNDYINWSDDYTGRVLNSEQRQILLKAWRANVQSLLSLDKNDKQSLTKLQKVISYMQDDAFGRLAVHYANLWYLTIEWLESLTLNDMPTPTVYAYLLSKLDAVISEQVNNNDLASSNSVKVDDSLVDVYIQLRSLDATTEEASSLLASIYDGIDDDNDFFPRLLTKLEQVIFQLDNPNEIIAPLKELKVQLHNRGWQQFQEQLTQVISDLEMSVESDELFSQMRWAIERQLQDLYAAIFLAHQTIDSKIGEQYQTYQPSVDTAGNMSANSDVASQQTEDTDGVQSIGRMDPQTIRQARIAIEDIKNAFNQFLHEHSSRILNKAEEFTTLEIAFEEMGLDDVVSISKRSAQIFQSIVNEKLTHITWDLTEAIADALASLELFMDYLAQQTLDATLLEQVNSRLIQAEQYLEDILDKPDILKESSADLQQTLSSPSRDVTRYDDTGELVAEVDEAHSNKASLDDDSSAPTYESTVSNDAGESEELIAARAELKPDEFDMDEEIRDIFIEEAEEVQEVLNTYLPKWQADPQNLEPLGEIRRGFHTLKGSGRMVGAHNAGEMAWAVENLLNRVLDGTLNVDDQLITFITETKDLIPTLVDDFSKQQPPSIDPAITVLKAHNLQKGRAIDFGLGASLDDSGLDDIGLDDVALEVEGSDNNDLISDKPLLNEESSDQQIDGDKSVDTIDKSVGPNDNEQPSIANVESEELIAARAELKPDEFDMDEEIRDIFIEEAEEVQEVLNTYLPKWQADPQNLEPLGEIRRGFHTLKGSGRMVGAHNAGEMAWAVENLLNRVLDGTLNVDDQLITFITETKDLIPTLVDDFSKQQSPSIDPAITVLKAHNLQKGRAIDFGLNVGANNVADVSEDFGSDLNVDSDDTDSDNEKDAIVIADDASIASDISEDAPVVSDSIEKDLPDVLQPFMADVNIPADANDADPDIKEIFIEEAQEVLEEITPKYKKWQANLEDFEALTEVRRGFHTLKGSGRMVGANSTAELAWAVENMLNRVLDESITPSLGVQALVGDIINAYPEMVQTYQKGDTNYPEQMALWIACAHAYTKKLGDDFDYRSFVVSQNNQISSDGSIEDSGMTPDIISDADGGVLDSMTTANMKLQQATSAVDAIPKDNSEFEQVFFDEASELIEKIEMFIKDNEGVSTIAVDDDIVRAFHTLRGAAGSQSLKAISDVSSAVESSLEQLQQHDEPMTANHLQAIAKSVSLIKQYVEDFKALDADDTHVNQQDVNDIQGMFDHSQESDSSSAVPFNISDIISDDIDDLLDAEWVLEGQLNQQDSEQVALYAEVLAAQCQRLLSRVSNSKKFVSIIQSLEAVYLHINKHPKIVDDKSIIDALLAGHGQLTGLFDALAASLTLKLDNKVIEDLHAIAEPKVTIGSSDGAQTVSSQESIAQDIEFEDITTDAELLEIFLEEAQEIDADIVNSFNSWKENPKDLNALKVLQRHLHTIKGGARMAGITSIGDLTHEAETVYEYFVEGRIEPTMAWVNVMQGVQDTLSQQIDYMVNNGRSFYATRLVEQLHELSKNKDIPDDYRLELPTIAAPNNDTTTESTTAEITDVTEQSEDITDIEFNRFKLQSWGGKVPDADILEVFLEEAEELVDSSAMNMQAFRTNTGDIAALQELQRELHTMKGGARMVAANGIADIAHHMETVYEDLASRRRPATKMVSKLLAACHDWIADAIYLLKHGINPPEPKPLIQALENFSASPDDLRALPQVSLQEYMDVINKYEEWSSSQSDSYDISEMPLSAFGSTEADEANSLSNEMIRVSSGLMEQMINLSGESAINRARIDMSVTSLNNTIDEMGMTVQRLADQLRRMDIELEAQILSQIDEETKLDESFDPLEMDQYSSLNQLSKSLSESASDLLDIKTTMLDKTRDAEDLLLQLSRTQAELQDGLMNSRMVPFSRLTPRLQRIVRQTANELDKSVELTVINADDEMDRTILERITSPLEHMLRNAVDHGIETPEERTAQGKDATGRIVLEVTREGSEVVIKLSDDGRGINVDAVRKKAISQGLIDANDTSLTDLDVMQYIFNAGLTTTSKVTQISGRGVGMDVVLSEIRQLGGTVSVESHKNKGSTFAMRVPLTVAISDALVVRVADRYYAIPLIQIERVERVNPEALFEYYQSDSNTFEIEGTEYRLRYLNEMLSGVALNELAVNMNVSLPVIIVKNQTGQNLAIQVDEVAGSRIEVVVKPLGRQLSQIAGLSAATIMGDGSVMLILDILALIRNAPARSIHKTHARNRKEANQARPKILVVDDSVTVRKVTTRLLERQGYETFVARDGVDALEILQELKPDLMLLDIEMPRMDGFDVAQNVRHDNRLKDLPIIMITSRTGDKHRERAMEIGVNDYMGKPFQEAQLISTIQKVIGVTTEDNYD